MHPLRFNTSSQIIVDLTVVFYTCYNNEKERTDKMDINRVAVHRNNQQQ